MIHGAAFLNGEDQQSVTCYIEGRPDD